MIKYQIRSRELLDLVNDCKNKRLIISPYFQRDLVWRELHKVDFIKTIIDGFPFPQIFIARGKIDVEKMTSISCIVDGQQRMNSINEYVQDKFEVYGKKFSEFTAKEKEVFLKYEVPIIDLDLSEDDPAIVEIFKRVNRTFYSLSKIEKLATEYSPSEYMLVAKILSNQLSLDDDEEAPTKRDPNVPSEFYNWAEKQKVKDYQKWLLKSNIFTNYEISRKVPLMFTMNIMSTLIGGIFNRNELTEDYLNQYTDNFNCKNEVIKEFELTASKILKLKIKSNSYFSNKANAFSLFIALSKFSSSSSVNYEKLKYLLDSFELNTPVEYALAAREAVNNKRERGIRDSAILQLLEAAT